MDQETLSLVRQRMDELNSFMASQKDVTTKNTEAVQNLEAKLRRYMESRAELPNLGDPAGPATLGSIVSKSASIKEFATSRLRGSARVQVPGRVLKAIIVTDPTNLRPSIQSQSAVALTHPSLAVSDLIPSRQVGGGSQMFVRQKSPGPVAAPQIAQGDTKAEGAFSFESVTLNPATLAVWCTTSRQAIEDVAGLQMTIDSELVWAVRTAEELEILSGDGTVGHLTGLLPQATVYTPAGGTSGLDIVAALIAAVSAQGGQATGVVMNGADYLKLALVKTTTGEYLVGPPAAPSPQSLWGVTLITSAQMPVGTVLCGDFVRGSELLYVNDAEVEISSEHSDNFVRNLLTIRCEERLTLLTKRPKLFVKAVLPATFETESAKGK